MINSRIIHKHDTEANWNKATGFSPLQGEIIVYDKDENYNYERFKIGDGITIAKNLPFANFSGKWEDLEGKPFYESTEIVNEPLNITWDGNTDGLASVPVVADQIVYRISDAEPTLEQLQGGSCEFTNNDNVTSISLGDATVFVNTEQVLLFGLADQFIIAVLYEEVNGSPSGLYVPYSIGTNGDSSYCSSITTTEPVEHTKTVVHKLDEKYLPCATDSEMLEFLVDMDIVQPLSDNNGTVYTATDNKLYVL